MQNYEQVKVLGQGGFGKAILGKRKSDGYMVCIKEVRLTNLSAKDREDAMKEIKVLASLNHPYIVKYIESFQERGNLYIVMEYANGGDLAQKIEKQGRTPFSEEEIMKNFIQIALAIKYIHDRKILHRDLKGQNIFLMKDGTVKLGDFGIARVLEHTFQCCKTQIGTPFYLSPEICQGKNYNSKTDIWSLGCILYELCTLKHAFEAANMNALLMNIVRGRYSPIPAQYSQDLRNLVDKMLIKEPEKRPNINQILTLPFIKNRLSDFLSETLLAYEMNHTVIHGRKAYKEATLIVPKKKEEPPAEAPAANNNAAPNNNDKPAQPAQPAQQAQPAQPPQKSPEQLKKEQEIREKQRQMMIEAKKRQQEAEEQERKRRQAREEAERLRVEREQQAAREREEAARKAKQDEFDDRNRVAQMNRDRAKGGIAFDYNDPTVKNPLQLQRERDRKLAEEQYNKQMARGAQPHYPAGGGGGGGGADPYAYREQQREAYQRQQQAEQQRRAEMERRKKEKEQEEQMERQRIYMEQKRAREANKNRNRQEMFGANECFQYNDPDPEPPRRRQNDREARQRAEEEERKRIWQEQHREAQANRNRARNDMRGDNMRDALMYEDNDPYEGQHRRNNDREARQRAEEEERKRIWLEQHREAQANRNRARNDMRGDNLKEALLYEDNDPYAGHHREDKRKAEERAEAERRRLWEEQRAAARANKEKIKNQEMRGNAAAEALRDGYDDDPYIKDYDKYRDERIGRHEINEADRRKAWEEQRAAARANRERMKNLEMGGGAAAEAMRDGYDDDPYDKRQDDRIAKHEINEADRRRAWEEQRAAAKANRERMKNLEMGGGAAADALRDGDSEDDYDRHRDDRIAKHEINEADRRKAWEEQRAAAKANRERMKNLEMGGGAAAEAMRDGGSEDDYDRHRDDRIAKHEINEADRRKAWEEQRAAAKANRERMKNLEMGGGAAAEAMRDGGSEDDYDRHQDDRIAKHEINEADRRKAWEEQRAAAKANRERMKNLEMGGGAAAEAMRDGGSEDDYDRHKDDRIAKHEISEADRRKAWEEQRAAVKANREKMKRLEMGGGAAADAMRDGDSEDSQDRVKDDRIAKHEISEADRRKAWEEQRAAVKANREKMKRLEMGGGAAADAMRDGDSEDSQDRIKDDRIAKHEISEADRRKAWEEQRAAVKANREKMKRLEMGGGAAADAMKDGDSEDSQERVKDDRIAKHEISDADRRKAWEEQRAAVKANREKMKRLEMGGGAAADAMKDGDSEDSQDRIKDDRISKHEISDADRRKAWEEQRAAVKANRERMKNVEMGGGPTNAEPEPQSEPSSGRKSDKKHEPTAEELAELARQQRREARANRERLKAQAAGVNMDQLVQEALGQNPFGQHGGGKIPRDGPVQQQDQQQPPPEPPQDDEPPPKKPEKHQPTAEELAELARQQRREARANRERLKAQAAGVNMDQLVQEALGPNPFGQHGGGKIPRDAPEPQKPPQAEQKASEAAPQDDEPPPKKPEKHEPTAEELKELARQQRREARANRERLKAQAAGVDMDKLVQEALGDNPFGQHGGGKIPRDAPQPQNEAKKEEAQSAPATIDEDDRPPQKEKVHEITPEERRAAWNEQRAIRKKAEAAAAQSGLDELAALEAEMNAKPKKKRPPPKFLARLQKKNGDESSDEPSSARSQPDPEIRRKPKPVQKPVEMPKIEEEPKGMNMNFSQALSSKNAKEFLKSRTLVMEQLNKEDAKEEKTAGDDQASESFVPPSDADVQAERGNEPTPEEQQSIIEDRAKFIEEALCIDDKEAANEDDFESESAVNADKDKSCFHLDGVTLNLPVARDTDSTGYRAEALRVFLEKEIGFDRVIELKQMMNNPDAHVDMNKYLKDIQPGLILLVQHLLILDDDSSALKLSN